MRASILTVVALLGLVGTASQAAADDLFHPVPAAAGQTPGLELRVVRYGQGVHGEMVVEVHNPSATAATFVSSGLYFLPDAQGDEEAPQRLAIVGGIRAGSEDAPTDLVSVAAGGTRKLRFDVYCIDASRHSPSTAQPYTLASARLPERTVLAIHSETRTTMRGVQLRPTPEQASMIQSQVWEARRRARARLLGE